MVETYLRHCQVECNHESGIIFKDKLRKEPALPQSYVLKMQNVTQVLGARHMPRHEPVKSLHWMNDEDA